MLKKVLSFICLCCLATNAQSAGYQIQEYSVAGMGRAFAGVGVMGDDFSSIAYNPAGMTLNTTSGFQLGLTGIDVRTTVNGNSKDVFYDYGLTDEKKSDHTFTRLFRLMPNAFGQQKINEKTTLGIGFYVPYGLATDYPNGWYGEVHGAYSGITVVDLSPSIAYQVLDCLSVGFGMNLQYAVAHLTGGVPLGGKTDIRGDDLGMGYILGFVWHPIDTLKLGLSYRSAVDHKLHGHNKTSGITPIPQLAYLFDGKYAMDAKITTPETIIFSLAQKLNQKWTFSGLLRWTRWSRFNQLALNQENKVPLSLTNEKWRNTWFASLGADYQLTKNWILRMGTAYDQAAVRRPEYRTPRIPDARRLWISGGLSYQQQNWQLDLGYAHLFIKKTRATGTAEASGSFSGNYDSKSDIAGIQFQYKF